MKFYLYNIIFRKKNILFSLFTFQEVLGDVLADALSQVARVRPPDPIQYIADYLHSVNGKKKKTSDVTISFISVWNLSRN